MAEDDHHTVDETILEKNNNGDFASQESKFKGVRKRKWGKWVSEIRLPNSRERIWLGSYDKPEKAARAFDAAQYCLRGPNAKFNFPDTPPAIVGGHRFTSQEIQAAATKYATGDDDTNNSGGVEEEALCNSLEPPSYEIGDGGDGDTAVDWSLLDVFDSFDNGSASDFGIYPDFDDNIMMGGIGNEDFYNSVEFGAMEEMEERDEWVSGASNFLWNFDNQ